MKRSAQIFSYFLLIAALIAASSCSKKSENNAITKKDAEGFMASYVSTLKSGDTEAIKKYWSGKSLNRKGFDVMHLWVRGLIHISEWKSFLDSTQYDYHIEELLDEDGYYVISGEWKKPDIQSARDESHPMPFYLVRENNRWLLGNPIDVLTRNWERYETENIVFFYPEDIDVDNHLHEMKLLNEDYQTMCEAMEFSLDEKIEYYKASSPAECGRLLTQPPFNGLAAVTYQDSITWFQIAVSTTFYNPHEVMHIVALSSGVPYSNSFLSEGLAVAYGGTTFQTAGYAHVFSRIMLDKADYIPIKRLLTMSGNDFLRSSYITYQESGSFIRYVIDTYGMEKLRSLVSGFNASGDMDAQSVKVYGVSFDELEKEWKAYLGKIELPKLGFSIPGTAKLVFGKADPENDDRGDGDYKYPSNENYIKGCFDLKRFEVFKKEDRVYFRISLHTVIEPVENRPGGVKFIPAIVIAINKKDENGRQLYKYTNEVELVDGYDLKINVGFGVNVSNSLGKIFISTSDAYSEMAYPESNTLTFSLPIELIGEPRDEWRYFVGVGLANEATFNFSGLAPVFKSVPGLISGGNYDYSNPAFIDILLPENIDQSGVLSDYDSEKGKLATIRMISYAGENF